MDLDIRHYLAEAQEHRDSEALQAAYQLMREPAAAGGRGRAEPVPAEIYVVCAETALQLGCLEISTACLKIYFEGNPPANQFVCRAYLCQGELKSPPATGSVEDFEEAVKCFLKAIEISKQEPRYHFMVFNASVLYLQTVRPLLQPGRCLHLVPSLKQVVQSLEEVADPDHSWRAELMIHLLTSLVDSGKLEDATSFAEVTEEFIKSRCPHLYPELFTLLVKHKLSANDVLLETSRQTTKLAVIYKIQDLKKLREIDENKLEDSAEFQEIFHLLVKSAEAPSKPEISSNLQQTTPIQSSDRVALLLELALLALQVKHQKVAADCLKELKSSGEASLDQRIVMECVNCEMNLMKKEGKMNIYSKASVEARLQEIGKLDQWLQTAVREGGPQAVQTVCATQWSFCLPLLQHNLRKHTTKPLLRVAQALEDIQSMALEMRCHVHSELAVIEEEEGHLQASLTHLQQALLLDNGTQRECLLSALRLLQLRQTVYQTPSRAEEKAAMLLQQIRDIQPQDKAGVRPSLVTVGLLLAPEDFQAVLDADDASEIPRGSPGSGPVARLAAQAQHHSTCMQRADSHLARQGNDANAAERVNLWATLVKRARKLEVYDVCRAACRFCLLYDDGRWKVSKADKCRCLEGETCTKCLHSSRSQSHVQLLRFLAEIHLISAEVIIQKLLTAGMQLNSPAVPPSEGRVSEDDPDWIIYRDWIQALSALATSSFLRAGELGAEIRESWVVSNAAIYLWNYNSHLLAAGEYQRLLPTFQRVVEMLQKTEHIGNHTLFVLLCDAVARGLIQPLSGPDSVAVPPAADKGKSRAEKGMEKAASVHGDSIDPVALQDVCKALELCEYALRIPPRHIPGETVPIAARKQLVTTWVQIKRLLQQQIGSKMDTVKNESNSPQVSAMTRVLVGVEMLRCNRNPRHMEFSVPSLSALVVMASECSWSFAALELQVWCQLAAFCHHVKDHSLVLSCTKRALQLEDAALKSLSSITCVLYSQAAVNKLLSSAACLRGLNLVHGSSGDLDAYREGLKVLLSSVSFAKKADDPALCVTTARHYWNACLPLTQSPEERWRLQQHLETILSALFHTGKHENKDDKKKGLQTPLPMESSKRGATNEDSLALRAALYSLLFHILSENTSNATALQLLDKALKDIPKSRHLLPLLKYRILVKARQGENIQLDIKKFEDEEQGCSLLWHQVALCADTVTQQLLCYQRAITCLKSPETRWKKVSLLLEFGEWLYSQNFPKPDCQHQVQMAIDFILYLEPEQKGGAEDESIKTNLSSVQYESLVGVQGSLFTRNVSSLKEVCSLNYLIQAHTLLAVMADKTSPEHQLNLLQAYDFVLQMWQVSISVACEISSETPVPQTLQPSTSAGSKKGKDKGKGKKVKDPTPAEERPKPEVLDLISPSTPREWARFICPDQARLIFRTNSNPQCISTHSITKKTQSLFFLNILERELHSLSLGHLTLPVMHLAEIIAHDLLDRRSLSDLYRLRIVRTCIQLGLDQQSPYQMELVTLSSVQGQEQIRCRRLIALSQERRCSHKVYKQRTEMDGEVLSCPPDPTSQDIWLDKAEVCLSLGLHQSARRLLEEAHMVATDLGDHNSISRSLLCLASLACAEQNYDQALILLGKSQTLGGSEEFWYQLTLTKVTAVVGHGDIQCQTKVDEIIKQGCAALRLILDQRVNRVPELTFMITLLEKRGAVESIKATGGGEPGQTLSTEAAQRLKAACATLKECARVFTQLNRREQAADVQEECAQALRLLGSHSTGRKEQQRFLLDALLHMQQAVAVQEHVALNAQQLLPSQPESDGLSLVSTRRLLRLRLALAEFCLVLLEIHCTEEAQKALSKQMKTSTEIALEEFTRCTPEPSSTEGEWLSVGRTLGQVVLNQLTAASSPSQENMETRARCLCLEGKYVRLQALQEEPILMCGLWNRNTKKEAWLEPETVSKEEESCARDTESCRNGSGMTSAKIAELQRRNNAQKLFENASKVLSEAVSLCLQHNLSTTTLAEASLNMLECHGQSEPTVAGQHLAVFQSCCTVTVMSEVLYSACADTGVSQLSALLCLRRNLLLSQEEMPSSMLRGVENSLTSLSKAFSHLKINPSHLSILADLPPNVKILLLQHSEDGSQLYGAFYETSKAPKSPKGKAPQVPGTLMCSRVAKISVWPQTLLALRERIQTFCEQNRHTPLQTDHQGGSRASEENQNTAGTEKLAPRIREIVQYMEDYLNPLLTQFDFSCLRPPATSTPAPEMTKTKDKEEKGSSDKLPAEAEEYVVILADRMLLELPLESLSIFQEEGLNSVSRDFSLQLFYSRLNKEEPKKVESDNKKETKGGKGTKGKGDQSQAIKAISSSHALPPNTIPVDTRNFKYIVDPDNEGLLGGTSLSTRVMGIFEAHDQPFTHLWEGLTGSQQTPSLSEMEQVLCSCSAFIYVGLDHFLANIPPAKVAASYLSECRMALLFDRIQNNARILCQSNFDIQTSGGQSALERPFEAALLLSLGGVGCVVLNQWQSSLQHNTHDLAVVLNNMLRSRQTSGQAIHALRKEDSSEKVHLAITGSDDQVLLSDSKEDEVKLTPTPSPSAFNCILYGLPNLIVI